MTAYKLAAAIFLMLCAQATAQTSFWNNSAVPVTKEVKDNSVTLGLKFYSDVPGSITGVRFYKSSLNTGTHVGTLWSSSGTKLASVTFSGESASGWQQAMFSAPVSIAANTTYIVSYSAPYGYYSCDQMFPWSSLSASPLHVSGTSPGVYGYGSGTVFPGSTWNQSNYWVDLVFSTSGGGTTSGTYSISGTVSGAASVTVTLSGAVARTSTTNSLGQFTFGSLPNGSYVAAPSKSGYTFTPSTRSVTINSSSVTGVNFTGTAVANPVPHTVTLSWKASTSTNLKGYYVYRADVAGGAYAKMNSSPMSTLSYTDGSVASGRTYYYVTTAVDSNNRESSYSNQATAVVPSP